MRLDFGPYRGASNTSSGYYLTYMPAQANGLTLWSVIGGSGNKEIANSKGPVHLEDGALHAEKYYRTVTEEFAATRPVFRWRQLVALARVTASEYGRPAPGIAEAREMLKV